MSMLFTPIKLRDLTIKNRIWIPPMCVYSAPESAVTPWHFAHYGARAIGGAGLIIVEATAVTPKGRITPRDLGLWSDDRAIALQPLTRFIKEQGCVPAVQLAHAGRKASCAVPWEGGMPLDPDASPGWLPLAPSAVPFYPTQAPPHALTEGEINDVVAQFESAARRAEVAGYQAVEIHMAHGYLMHEFLSPVTNKRTDSYGGSFENRTRLPLRVAKAVREVWPQNLPVFVRLSATDWVEGGWDLDQTIALAKQLKALGIDFIDCSTGGLVPDAKVPVGPSFQVPFAQEVRKQTGLPVGAVGLITQPQQAEKILASGQADVVLIGREILSDPHWPLHAMQALKEQMEWPAQYLRART